MKKLSEIVCCVIDHGLFLPTAQKLAETFKETYYHTPTERAFPTLAEAVVGTGFDKLIRAQDLWKIKDDCDLFVFPDVGFGGLQRELVQQGFAVWGSRSGYQIETNREAFLNVLESLGMDIAPHKIVTGIEELRETLRDAKDKWIKISRFRGDAETFHWRSWGEDQQCLDALSLRFGPARNFIRFYVFDPIETEIEDGVDTYCIDGQMPSVCLHAMEKKDRALLGTMTDFKDIPEIIRSVSEKFAPALKEFNYRQFFSTEVRVTKDQKAYFIDPTLRCGSPPSQLQTELFGNLADIIWQGANGQCIDPDPTAKFGVQLEIRMKREPGEWAVARIPDHVRPFLKCGFAAEIDGQVCIPPSDWMTSEFGWLVSTGDTIEAAIDSAKELAGELPEGLECDTTCLASLLEEVHEAEKLGMEFTDQTVPKPASVL